MNVYRIILPEESCTDLGHFHSIGPYLKGCFQSAGLAATLILAVVEVVGLGFASGWLLDIDGYSSLTLGQ